MAGMMDLGNIRDVKTRLWKYTKVFLKKTLLFCVLCDAGYGELLFSIREPGD